MTRRDLTFLFVLTAALVALSVFFVGSEKLLSGTLNPGAAFSGMLALNGFMFTARTFITFKLNEAVYSKDEYRKDVARFQASGDYAKKLYDPLKALDSTVGRAALVCFATLFALALYSLLPRDWGAGVSFYARIGSSLSEDAVTLCFVLFQCVTWIVYSAVLMTVLVVLSALLRVNKNIHSIIEFWESTASAPASDSPKK